MGGVQGRCPVQQGEFRLSLFLGSPLLLTISVPLPPPPPMALSPDLSFVALSISRFQARRAVALFYQFFGDRTISGGRRSSVNSVDESSAYADTRVATRVRLKNKIVRAIMRRRSDTAPAACPTLRARAVSPSWSLSKIRRDYPDICW